MRNKILTITLALLALAAPVLGNFGGLTYHEVQITDELRRPATNITSVTVRVSGSVTAATIYADSARTLAITQPMTSSSTNTTLDTSNATFNWFGDGQWDYTITDGTNAHTNNGFLTMSASNSLIIYPSYIQTISSTSYTDAQTATFGTDSDWVLQGGNEAGVMTFTPAADNSEFRIGVSGTALNSDFNVYVGTALGLKVDAGVPSFIWDGGAASLNASSNFATNINTGTSTGAVNIGNSAGGAVSIDGAGTLSLNSDGAHSLTTTDASADITVDATLGSVIIDGGEAVADAVIIQATGAAGGIDMISLADIDISTTGAAGEDITFTNTGGSIVASATEAIADALTLTATAGGMDFTTAATFDIDLIATGGRIIATASEDVQNTVHIEANGGVLESINLYSNQGTGVSATTEHDASVQLHSDDGGISLYTTANLANTVRIETNGGALEEITINNLQGTGAAAVTIAANAAGGDVNIDSVLGRIEIEAEENVADAMFLIVDGGTTTTMKLLNDTGTSATDGAASVQITSDLGGIELLSSLAAANAIRFKAAGVVAANTIVLETTDSGIFLNADGGTNGDITIDAADVISLVAADPAGIVVTTATFEHKYQYYALSAGTVTATEVIVGGGYPLICIGLEAGVGEIGSTEGYVGIGDAADFLRFMIKLPADFIDTGTQADLNIEFDIDEQMGAEGTVDIRIFEYDDAANTTAIITDTITVANDATRQWYTLDTNAAGIGNEADLNGEETLIIEITVDNDTDDLNIYGIRFLYRVGVQALQ